MSETEGEGFVVRDRRGRGPEEGPTAGQGPKAADAGGHATPSETAAGATPHPEQGPPVTFSSFVFSLGTSALMLMGEKVDPNQPDMPANPGQAKEIVDILSLLEEKTRGNLNEDEQTVLRDMLYALRMKYVALVSGKPATPSP